MARSSETYRAARRNRCIRLEHAIWGHDWYYSDHRNVPDWAKDQIPRNNQKPLYVAATRQVQKTATTTGGVHGLLKRGDYAGAVRAFFRRERKATGRGS